MCFLGARGAGKKNVKEVRRPGLEPGPRSNILSHDWEDRIVPLDYRRRQLIGLVPLTSFRLYNFPSRSSILPIFYHFLLFPHPVYMPQP